MTDATSASLPLRTPIDPGQQWKCGTDPSLEGFDALSASEQRIKEKAENRPLVAQNPLSHTPRRKIRVPETFTKTTRNIRYKHLPFAPLSPRARRTVIQIGGGRGIRTPEALRLAGFQDQCIQPLCHPSKEKRGILYTISRMRAGRNFPHFNSRRRGRGRRRSSWASACRGSSPGPS